MSQIPNHQMHSSETILSGNTRSWLVLNVQYQFLLPIIPTKTLMCSDSKELYWIWEWADHRFNGTVCERTVAVGISNDNI
ncbi:hypothetical protein DPMN_172031 [Dreissena polymorpha]|uniref:Uncharacterized protein n=1 Tax=Dreissena polymorpha TaxID=45954 RepID=A0A9D4E082_DREPO|nr:hypothetical protein DPMN_172030 [Dreissena polymorpha]KAH3770738.1 hypothetical protein DPMN_172031 [Dreissena polymorpha]